MASSLPKHFHLAKNRYGNKEFLVDNKTYDYIMELIHFYHESIYLLPDEELIQVKEWQENGDGKSVNIPLNQLIFE